MALWEDLRDAIDAYMTSLVEGYASLGSGMKEGQFTAIARGAVDILEGPSVLLEEIPALPATFFASSPSRQFLTDAAARRGWGTYWENNIGTLSVDAEGYFKHATNITQNQRFFLSYNEAPRLVTPLIPGASRWLIRGHGKMTGFDSNASGIGTVGVALFCWEPNAKEWGHVHIRINRSAAPAVAMRYEMVINGTTYQSGASSSGTFETGTDMQIDLQKGLAAVQYRQDGQSEFTSLATVHLGTLVPVQAAFFCAHNTGLTTAPTLFIKPSYLYAER